MKTSTSGANSSLPPPINTVTKPKPSSANIINHSLLHVGESGTIVRQHVPVFINPNHVADLQEALDYLSELPHRQPKLELQADTIIDEEGNVQRVFFINPRQSQQEDAEDLASTFSDLSMSTLTCQHVTRTDPVTPTSINSSQSPLGIRTAPVANSGMSPQTSPRKRRYYVILVGKCASIYYDEWQVLQLFKFFCILRFLTLFYLPRENVEPLIRHVSGACYKGFSTHDQAKEFYLGAKRLDKVRIVRDPGDDKKYGPMEDAVQ